MNVWAIAGYRGMLELPKVPQAIIRQGDCLEVMAELASESFGLAVTSPPYNLLNSPGGGMRRGAKSKWQHAKYREGQGYDSYVDNIPEDEYQEWLYRVFTEVMRLLRPDGAAFVVFKWRQQHGLQQDRREVWNRFPVRQTLIWQRPGGINFNAGYFVPNYEIIYLIAQPEFRLAPGANGQGCIWPHQPDYDNDHPAPFPLSLARQIIASTPDNGPVIDPFVGSGTAGIAAAKLGRDFLGIDISETYCNQARAKIARAQAMPELL